MASDASSSSPEPLHVLMFPYLAFGHISPFIQLATKISAAAAGNIHVTFLSAASNVARIRSLIPSSSSVSVVALRLPAVPGLPPGAESTADLPSDSPAVELLKLAVDGTRPQVDAILRELRPHVAVFDFAMQWLPEVAEPLGVRSVFFSVFAAVSTAYLTVPARRLHGPNPSVEDLKSPPAKFPEASSIRGVPAYQAADFLYIFRTFAGASVFERVLACMSGSSAIMAKTCAEMEGPYVDYVAKEHGKPVLLAGPITPEPPTGELDPRWVEWLGGFPAGAVVFSSFGSETFLSEEGVRELLLGLEMTGMPFLAVLNPAKGEEGKVGRLLPEGWAERVKGRGLVHSGWVQQQHILRHDSVGVFLCHAGLSSVMEAVAAGCRLAMLPQKGDQYLNARLFAGDMGIGVEVERREEDGGFTREAVCAAVREVTASEEVKEKHSKWREFLLDKEAQEGFAAGLLDGLRKLANV
ncbi:anthocyanidin-3-O-glucoside rhamnosyltransferase-like [Curcuma longa]|uniref:anthocyanidin-3-O-glucoside rhamnosyltransferase-like n=1 Tax=Curcuma longa TaxID=136217 RepID=UPI003D9E819A